MLRVTSRQLLRRLVCDGRLKLKDLNSKNGTIVERDRKAGVRVLVMLGHNARLRADALSNGQEVRVVSEVDACLGDLKLSNVCLRATGPELRDFHATYVLLANS